MPAPGALEASHSRPVGDGGTAVLVAAEASRWKVVASELLHHFNPNMQSDKVLFIPLDVSSTLVSKVRDWFPGAFLQKEKVFAIQEVEPTLLKLFTRAHENTNRIGRKRGGKKVLLMGREVFGDTFLACGRCGYHSSDYSNVRKHHRRQICLMDRGYNKDSLKKLGRKERSNFLQRLSSRRYREKCRALTLQKEKDTTATDVLVTTNTKTISSRINTATSSMPVAGANPLASVSESMPITTTCLKNACLSTSPSVNKTAAVSNISANSSTPISPNDDITHSDNSENVRTENRNNESTIFFSDQNAQPFVKTNNECIFHSSAKVDKSDVTLSAEIIDAGEVVPITPNPTLTSIDNLTEGDNSSNRNVNNSDVNGSIINGSDLRRNESFVCLPSSVELPQAIGSQNNMLYGLTQVESKHCYDSNNESQPLTNGNQYVAILASANKSYGSIPQKLSPRSNEKKITSLLPRNEGNTMNNGAEFVSKNSVSQEAELSENVSSTVDSVQQTSLTQMSSCTNVNSSPNINNSSESSHEDGRNIIDNLSSSNLFETPSTIYNQVSEHNANSYSTSLNQVSEISSGYPAKQRSSENISMVPVATQKPKKRRGLSLGPIVHREPVKRVQYDLYTVATGKQRIAWKPAHCHKAPDDSGPCHIAFRGARRSRRCLSLPLPCLLLYRKLDCRIHHCHFTLFHPHSRQQETSDPKVHATVKIRIYTDTVMTQEFHHYLRSLHWSCRLKPSQAARHISGVWTSVLSDRLDQLTRDRSDGATCVCRCQKFPRRDNELVASGSSIRGANVGVHDSCLIDSEGVAIGKSFGVHETTCTNNRNQHKTSQSNDDSTKYISNNELDDSTCRENAHLIVLKTKNYVSQTKDVEKQFNSHQLNSNLYFNSESSLLGNCSRTDATDMSEVICEDNASQNLKCSCVNENTKRANTFRQYRSLTSLSKQTVKTLWRRLDEEHNSTAGGATGQRLCRRLKVSPTEVAHRRKINGGSCNSRGKPNINNVKINDTLHLNNNLSGAADMPHSGVQYTVPQQRTSNVAQCTVANVDASSNNQGQQCLAQQLEHVESQNEISGKYIPRSACPIDNYNQQQALDLQNNRDSILESNAGVQCGCGSSHCCCGGLLALHDQTKILQNNQLSCPLVRLQTGTDAHNNDKVHQSTLQDGSCFELKTAGVSYPNAANNYRINECTVSSQPLVIQYQKNSPIPAFSRITQSCNGLITDNQPNNVSSLEPHHILNHPTFNNPSLSCYGNPQLTMVLNHQIQAPGHFITSSRLHGPLQNCTANAILAAQTTVSSASLPNAIHRQVVLADDDVVPEETSTVPLACSRSQSSQGQQHPTQCCWTYHNVSASTANSCQHQPQPPNTNPSVTTASTSVNDTGALEGSSDLQQYCSYAPTPQQHVYY